ncbi:MAG TPA: right-handed parallel beta-helix repeat-containing protein [Gemmatimonadaceae bacterium]|nr:right-handed parallel beta-helix repeat-containing protein [Gemmatimonadaceae bacterium]
MNRRQFVCSLAAVAPSIANWPPLRDRVHGGRGVFDRISVKDFGARGDGINDDTRAFRRALERANNSGSTVIVPNGRYVISDTLKIGSGVRFEGEGTTAVISYRGINPIPVYCLDATAVGVANLIIEGKFSFGLLVQRSSKVSVTGCAIRGGNVRWQPSGFCGGIFVSESDSISIQHNDLESNGFIGGGVLSADIQVNGFGRSVSSAGIRIAGNRCRSVSTQCSIAAYDVHGAEIVDNVCSGAKTGHGNNNGYGILIYERPESPQSCYDNTVVGNEISNTEGSGIYLQRSQRSRVSRNTLSDVALIQTDETLPVAAIALNQSEYAHIQSNTITRVGRAGISIASNRPNVGHVEVTHNSIVGAGGIGIHLRGLLVDIAVVENLIRQSAGGICSISDDHQQRIVISRNTVFAPARRNPGILLRNATESSVHGNVVNDASGYGIDLVFRDLASHARDNIVTRTDSSPAFEDVRVTRKVQSR